MNLWQRYLLSRLTKTFLFFLLCIVGLYIAIDFSIHGAKIFSKGAPWQEIGAAYLGYFAKFTCLFFSLSFLLAMLRVLLDLNGSREIVALQTAGVSSKKLLFPFFFFASLLASLSYANFQWILPKVDCEPSDEKVFSLVLEDGSELIYQSYDPEKKELFDVFWVLSFDEIWHMKRLNVGIRPLQGHFIDRFIRIEDGSLEKDSSTNFRFFPELNLEEGASLKHFAPFENRSLSTLWRQANGDSSENQKSASHLHYKLAEALIPILLIFSIAPFAISFSRSRSNLLFIASALFAYIGLMTLLDAMLILAENHALPAMPAIWAPFAATLTISWVFFSRMR